MAEKGQNPRAQFLLPSEILLDIISYIDEKRQQTLYSCCLTSRRWYSVSIVPLYEKPVIHGANFQQFVNTICPESRAYAQKGDLGKYVRRLDLSGIVHHSSKSLTARLLGRVKDGLEVFIAPANSFS